ncbi:MAG: hypothetical protein HY646_01260 [Acidobacteria bacterium]|nr:hypothetical protein [Acidobacteriota bacterium]
MEATIQSTSGRVLSRLAWVTAYAIAMGLLEAICVIYLRQLTLPAGASLTPLNRWPIEIIREVTTIIMLVVVAWLAGANVRQRTAYFFLMFGVWDILYYVGLKWLADWPASWLAWDCLFLIPTRWYGPVLAPVLISGYFVVACGWLIIREDYPVTTPMILFQLVAGAVWYWSFVKDSAQIAANGYAGIQYSWLWFASGTVIGTVGLWWAARHLCYTAHVE